MPLTPFQMKVARLLSVNRSSDSHLAGGAALHFSPRSTRYSNDLDYFHDSVERVVSAFVQDEELLRKNGYTIAVELKQPGYLRALVSRDEETTKVEWSHDAAWRFLPAVADRDCGFMLHPIDLAINKVLALVGRNEPRDLLDVHYAHGGILPLGALCWGAAGKDPGFTPRSLLELLKRRGKVRPEEIARLKLVRAVDVTELKSAWLEYLASAETFVRERPPSEIGCLYYSEERKTFFAPKPGEPYLVHYGAPGGILPVVVEG